MSETTLFKIAKIVSNEFIGKDKSFEVKRYPGYYFLSTSTCDMCPMIRVHCDPAVMIIEKVEVNGDYTDGWQNVRPETMGKINNLLITIESLNN